MQLFLISFLALFMELLLIRWIGTEINIFAYLQNTVLVVCFMGLGMGCLTSRRPIVIRNLLVSLLIVVALMAVPVTRMFLRHVSVLLAALGDLIVWQLPSPDSLSETALAVAVGLAATFGLMFVIWQIFVPIGRILGRLMDDHPRPISAYSINIAGSLVGIWAFVLLSTFYQPPGVWFLVVAALLGYFIVNSDLDRRVNILLLFIVAGLGWFVDSEPNSIKVIWSPYQKLVLTYPDPAKYPLFKYFLTVNSTWYQGMIDLSPETTRSHPSESRYSQYDIPFLLHPRPERVLIVGSGTGNDVAAALRHSARQIVAVEIDPAIIELGRALHPERPYDSPAVQVVNDDARSFFSSARERYDVISFGLLDSHTTTSMTNARLDHYVYTKESLQIVRSLLADGGIMTLIFQVQRYFIADRIAGTLREVFGEEPLFFRIPPSNYGPGGVVFVAGDLAKVRERLGADAQLTALIQGWKAKLPMHFRYRTEATSDDWPYLYLDSRRIPILYYLLALTLLGLFLYTGRGFGDELNGSWSVSHWHFFFLGAAFLLLEVQSISKASVVLGNTWQVNAVIISGILAMVLSANLTAARFPNMPLRPVYAGLIVSCITLYFTDLARFAPLAYGHKAAIVALLTALPVLFGGIIFIRSFAKVSAKDVALGANMMGSLAGGLLQSVTFVTGIKALLLIVAGLYFAAMICDRNRRALRSE